MVDILPVQSIKVETPPGMVSVSNELLYSYVRHMNHEVCIVLPYIPFIGWPAGFSIGLYKESHFEEIY